MTKLHVSFLIIGGGTFLFFKSKSSSGSLIPSKRLILNSNKKLKYNAEDF